jgi:hypothetical protein
MVLFFYLVNLGDSITTKTADNIGDFEMLELSIWSKSSSKWRTPYTVIDGFVIDLVDQPSEFYIVGGYQSQISHVWRKIQKLDLNDKNKYWIELENVTIPIHLASSHMGSAVFNGRLYIFTGQQDYGCGPATRASAYMNLSTHQWVNLPDVPEARYSPQVVITNNHVHLFAGAKPDRVTPAFDYWILDLERFDQGWLKGPSLPESGDHGRKALIDDWIYLMSFEHGHSPLQINHTGIWDGKRPVNCPGEYIAQPGVFKIDSKNKKSSSQWIRLSDIPRPVSHAGSVVLNNKFVLLIGGIGPVGDRPVPYIQLFDSHSNRWRLLSPLPGNAKSPLLWINQEQSILYLQACSSSITCRNEQAHIIWSHKAKTERCLFYTHLNCTTRKLQSTPYAKYRRIAELKWINLFSQIYLMNMPSAVERLRQTWYELNRVDLTSITLFESFQVQNIEHVPILIQQDLIWPAKMKMWKAKNDTKAISYYIRSSISIKLIFMNLWTKNIDEQSNRKPVLILEDDIKFLRSKDETLEILERILKFLENHPEIEWDLLYLSYRDIEATHTYQISDNPSINLWRASKVLSNTAFIINKNPRSIENLNKCYFHRLDTVDGAICYCLKHQSIRAYLIEPKLAQARPGFSFTLNQVQDYNENDQRRHMVNNYTPPATFKTYRQVIGKRKNYLNE